MFKHKLWLLVSLAVILAWLCSPGNAETQYSFNYYFTNAPNKGFSGYVYAPDGWLTVGSTITNQPNPMGGAALGGYYYITAVNTGYSSSYDKQEYLTDVFEGTSIVSYNIYNDGGWNSTVDHSQKNALYIADRSTTDEAHTGTYNGAPTNYFYVWGTEDSNTYFVLGSSNLYNRYDGVMY